MIEVEGPLGACGGCVYVLRRRLLILWVGKMVMQIPPYMRFSHDPETRKATLEVQNRGERQQREMWGGWLTEFGDFG
jgi:hypothetical protein